MFTSFSVTARDGMRLSAPSAPPPSPDMHVAQSYDFGDFAFIDTRAGIVAIDAGTSPDRGPWPAMADLGLKDRAPVSHLILTHAHFDHIGGSAALRGPLLPRSSPPQDSRPKRNDNAIGASRVIFTGTDANPASDVKPDRLIKRADVGCGWRH